VGCIPFLELEERIVECDDASAEIRIERLTVAGFLFEAKRETTHTLLEVDPRADL
jgi:hypothetical protein